MPERSGLADLGDPAAWERLLRMALPIVAVLVFASSIGAVLAVAGDTLGYDFLAYHSAARRVLDGRPLYDLGFAAAGGFGLFYYPPLFGPFILPFGLLSASAATWAWIALLVAAFLVGVGLMPVSRTVRWWVLLLAGTCWLLPYAIKLGQVGPILFLLFAAGWRWLDAPAPWGLAAAAGVAVKLQPAVLLGWALLTRRVSALLVAVATLVLLAGLATLIAGPGSWGDFLTLLRQVADPITTAKNATPGAIAYQLGATRELATVIQWLVVLAAIAVVVIAALWATGEASYLVAVTASQLLSPILWDHYAVLLLLPVAYLCASGRWWALAIPVATAAPLIGFGPPAIYPFAFGLALVATLVVGIRAQRAEPDAPQTVGAAA
jgi:hypothetical protein